MNKKLLQYFNQVEKHHWWWIGRQQLIKNLLQDKNPISILDVGCGTGETLSFLKKTFPKSKLRGVDFLSEAVEYTKNRGHKSRRADALKLPFKDATFDVVMYLDVIEHIKDDNKVIKEARRVLKPGGTIIITAPALPFIWSDHDKNQGHFRRYTRRRLRILAAKNRLQISHLSYFNFFLSPPIIILRVLSRLNPFKHLASYDSKLNYDIVNKKFFNSLLKKIFVFEVNLLKYINYPIGISVAAEFIKN